MTSNSKFLREVLLIDAVASGGMGVLLLMGAGFLAGLLALPAVLLWWAGLALIPFAAVVAFLATRRTPPRVGVWAIIDANVAWVAASVLLLVWIAPNVLGYAFILAQAIVVAGLAALQYHGLRVSSPVATS